MFSFYMHSFISCLTLGEMLPIDLHFEELQKGSDEYIIISLNMLPLIVSQSLKVEAKYL